MKRQAALKERIYSIDSHPDYTKQGLQLSNGQIEEAKEKIRRIFLLSL
jgi:hypothetical protein